MANYRYKALAQSGAIDTGVVEVAGCSHCSTTAPVSEIDAALGNACESDGRIAEGTA